MTAQIPDKFVVGADEYHVIGWKGDKLPTPKDFGLVTGMWHTACYRGYVATWSVIHEKLHLTQLHIGTLYPDGSAWKPINGVEAEPFYLETTRMRDGKAVQEKMEYGWKYNGLKIAVDFSGGFLVASGFIRALYVHMGFGKPYQYKQVREYLFQDGKLTNVVDQSDKAQAYRDRIAEKMEKTIAKWRDLSLWQQYKDDGFTDDEIIELFSEIAPPKIRPDDIDIPWRFSLDYDHWF